MNVLAIAVHPDDETLGCGGTLLKLASQGATLHWLILSAVTVPQWSEEHLARQARQIEAVREAYPFASLTWLKLPATQLDRLPLGDIVASIRDVVTEVRPETVFIPNRADVHSDHRVAAQAANAVLKSFYMRPLGVRRVLACEVISETDAAPPFPENAFARNVFVDVTSTLERKLEIMSLFASEVQPEPMPRSLSSIRAQARFRGASIGVEYAEAFSLVREIL